MPKLWFGFAKYSDDRREFDLNFYWLKTSVRSYLLECLEFKIPPSIVEKEVYVFYNQMIDGYPPKLMVSDIAVSLGLLEH